MALEAAIVVGAGPIGVRIAEVTVALMRAGEGAAATPLTTAIPATLAAPVIDTAIETEWMILTRNLIDR